MIANKSRSKASADSNQQIKPNQMSIFALLLAICTIAILFAVVAQAEVSRRRKASRIKFELCIVLVAPRSQPPNLSNFQYDLPRSTMKNTNINSIPTSTAIK